MFDYRPPWAAAMTLESPRSKTTHLRAGWSAGLGFHPWCRRNKSSDPIRTVIQSAVEGAWVSRQDIQERDITNTDSNHRTCEACCSAWLRDADR